MMKEAGSFSELQRGLFGKGTKKERLNELELLAVGVPESEVKRILPLKKEMITVDSRVSSELKKMT